MGSGEQTGSSHPFPELWISGSLGNKKTKTLSKKRTLDTIPHQGVLQAKIKMETNKPRTVDCQMTSASHLPDVGRSLAQGSGTVDTWRSSWAPTEGTEETSLVGRL